MIDPVQDSPFASEESVMYPEPPERCYACGGSNFKERPTGGFVCRTCHPSAAEAERINLNSTRTGVRF